MLAAAILGSSIAFIDGTVVNVVLPVLQHELQASVVEVQWIVESYALMVSALILVGGSLGDRLGRRRVFIAGVLVFAAASLACGLAPGTTSLIAALAAQGVGAALLVPESLALISASFPEKERGKAIGTWSGFTAIAAGTGPVLGGWLVEAFSWRWIFFINIPLAFAVVVIAWRYVPESRDEEARGRLDWVGATLATLGLGGVVFGLIESSARGFSDPLVVASFVCGGAALVAFVVAEWRQKNPMIPLGLFRSRAFTGANLLTFGLYASLSAVLFFLPFDLIQVQGYTPTGAGAALLPFVLTMFGLSRWAGGLVHRYGSKLPLVCGPLIAGAGFAMFALPGTHAGRYWTSFFPAVVVMSFGMTISVAPLTTTVMSAVEERRAGTASGINNAVSRTAALLAIAVFGVVMVDAYNGALVEGLRPLRLSANVSEQLLARTADLLEMEIPASVSGETRSEIRQAINASFVSGFRRVALLSAALAAASALAALLLIPADARRSTRKRKS